MGFMDDLADVGAWFNEATGVSALTKFWQGVGDLFGKGADAAGSALDAFTSLLKSPQLILFAIGAVAVIMVLK